MALVPSRTTPSAATFSPGRTTNRLPTASSPIAARTSAVPPSADGRRIETSLAPRCMRLSSACLPLRLARASSQRPMSRKVVTTAAVSK